MTLEHTSEIQTATFVKGIVGDDTILYDKKPTFAFIGRSNVGKSSLVNSLCGKKDLVKVSPRSGKTREINYFLINKDRYFVDLPGYGYAEGSKQEKEKILGMIRGFLTTPHIVLTTVVLVVDARVGMTDFDIEMLHVLRDQKHPTIIVANKIDVLTQREKHANLTQISDIGLGTEVFPCSTKTGFGLNAIRTALMDH